MVVGIVGSGERRAFRKRRIEIGILRDMIVGRCRFCLHVRPSVLSREWGRRRMGLLWSPLQEENSRREGGMKIGDVDGLTRWVDPVCTRVCTVMSSPQPIYCVRTQSGQKREDPKQERSAGRRKRRGKKENTLERSFPQCR